MAGGDVHRGVTSTTSADAGGRPWWRRRAGLSITVLVVIALAIGGVLIARHQAGEGRLAVGETRAGGYTVSGSFYDSYRFSVPGATVTVIADVGDRASRLDDAADDFIRVKAPEDGQLVGVKWSAVPLGDTSFAGDHVSSLAIRSKDSSVVVDPAVTPAQDASYTSSDDEDHEKLVALPGDVDDLQLTLTFQGRTQSISLVDGRRRMGAFAPYYRSSFSTGVVSIGQDQPSDVASPFRWYGSPVLGGMTRTAYLDGLGWAKAGHEWAVVSDAGWRLGEDAARWSDGEHLAYYAMDGTPRTAITVNGARPVRALGKAATTAEHGSRSSTRDYVFSVPTGDAVTVHLAVTMPAKREAGEDTRAPERTTVRLRSDVTYPAVLDPRLRGTR